LGKERKMKRAPGPLLYFFSRNLHRQLSFTPTWPPPSRGRKVPVGGHTSPPLVGGDRGGGTKRALAIKYGDIALAIVLGLVLGVFLSTAHAQEVHLDKMQKCGDLLCYPSLKEPNVFYYLPDRPSLAVKDGRPQFSFLKYARTEKTGKAGIGQAEGGGIIHFLVTYGADQSRVKQAEKDLQAKNAQARIAGPIVYRKGSFALITSFQEGNETTTKTVAVGKAPLMEGQKAAVSMALTREGAEVLWESFKSDTPDISLVFDMEFAGVREPYEATLEADWSRISNHHRVQAGLRYSWFGADVDLLFQELRQSGAVKITTKGESAALEKILDSANNKLLQAMFDPAPDDLTRMGAEKGSYDNLNQAIKLLKADAAPAEKKSELMLVPGHGPRVNPVLLALHHLGLGPPIAQAAEGADSKAAKEAYEKGKELYLQKNYPGALEWFEKGLALVDKADTTTRSALLFNIGVVFSKMERCDEADISFKEAFSLIGADETRGLGFYWVGLCLETTQKNTEALASFRSAVSVLGEQSEQGRESLKQIEAISAKIYHEARHLDEGARLSGYEPGPSRDALAAYRAYHEGASPSGQRASEVEGRIRYLERKIGEKEGGATATSAVQTQQHPSAPVSSGEKEPGSSEKAAGDDDLSRQLTKALSEKGETPQSPAEKEAEKPASAPAAGEAGAAKAATASADKGKTEPTKASPAAASRKGGAPGFSLVASYQMKQIKRSGKLVYNMNHFRTENQAFAMTENIGDLYRRHGRDPRVFRAVTIDDPVFKQREILVTLDGQDAATFAEHLNFVTVKLEKRHQSGEVTSDEVVITPVKFNEGGNAFSLGYGYKGDDDRSAWLDYRFQALWSFHGGVEFRTPWNNTDSPMLAVQPPHRYRTVTVEGDGAGLTAAGVRHAVITLTSLIGGRTITKEVTIRNQGPAPALMVEIPEDPEKPRVEAGITWYLSGGGKVTVPARPVEGSIVYWDELPKKGV